MIESSEKASWRESIMIHSSQDASQPANKHRSRSFVVSPRRGVCLFSFDSRISLAYLSLESQSNPIQLIRKLMVGKKSHHLVCEQTCHLMAIERAAPATPPPPPPTANHGSGARTRGRPTTSLPSVLPDANERTNESEFGGH